LVLGQISQINAQDLAIALPNNLTGYVSLTRISSYLTKTIKLLLKDADEENDDIEVPSLTEMFTVGQWLRTVVVENTAVTGSDKSQKKHIELSIEPELVNASIVPADILPQSILQVSVSSIEDHGIIVSLGLPNLSGFIKNSSLGSYSVDKIKEGRVFFACVEQRPKNKVVQLTLNLKKSQKPTADVADIGSLLPGETVKCLLSEVRAAGAGGKILGMLDATIDQLHIGQASVSDNQNVKSLGNRKADFRSLLVLQLYSLLQILVVRHCLFYLILSIWTSQKLRQDNPHWRPYPSATSLNRPRWWK
jgi:rRNA biogenesis protein RRP5